MKSKYSDISSLVQVLGCLYNNPSLIDKTDRYKFSQEDFFDSFHQICFACINNMYQLGAKKITINSISDYLETRPKAKAEFELNKGAEFILKCSEIADINQFDFYYNRMKKMSLLRAYEDMGMNLNWIYDPDSLDTKTLQEQTEKLDNMSLEGIANLINDKIDLIKMQYVQNVEGAGAQIGDGVTELLESLRESPALGYPLFGKFINTITRGARLGKFYLRSAATGVGKSRSMIADACYIGCSQMYDLATNKWVSLGAPQPALFIATEQDLSECQTMCLAFLSGVDEEHILKNEYYVGEWERIEKACQLLKNSKIYFECLPDFTMAMIENTIKKHIREHQVDYIFFDYIHSSASILMEVGGSKGVKGLREDNVLFLLASKLKDIAVQYGVFILSSTQLNASYSESETPDQNCLRGSKAIADRIDVGCIMLDVTSNDIEKIKPFCDKNSLPIPNVKLSFYKMRQGRWKSIYVWLNADKSICRYDGLFVTDWRYGFIEMEDLKIKVEEESMF